MRNVGFLILVLLIMAGCESRAPMPGGQASSVSLMAPSADIAAEAGERLSLFKSDQDIIGNAELEKILALKLTTPDQARLAVLAVGQDRSRWAWSPEVTKAEEHTIGAFIDGLAASKRLGSVQAVPSLLMPNLPTIPRLRESAARLQADLLLIYAPRFQTYEKYRTFGRDETKAFCTVEAVILDVRSGIVRKTCVASEDFEAKRSGDDINFAETVRKAECQVLERALVRIAADVVKFLEGAP